MRTAALLLTIPLLAIPGCHHYPPSGPTSCADAYRAGTPTDTILNAGPCLDDNGNMQIVVSTTYDCPDGEHSVSYNDWGHGVNGGLWQTPFPADFTYDDVMADCP
jgi:hypothetical protein